MNDDAKAFIFFSSMISIGLIGLLVPRCITKKEVVKPPVETAPLPKEQKKFDCSNKLFLFKNFFWDEYKKNECIKGKPCCKTLKYDSGGFTCYGVAIKHNSTLHQNISMLKDESTRMEAIESGSLFHIFFQYYMKPKIDQLPYKWQWPVFDYGVHSGVSRAVKALQKQLGVKADGLIGEKTLRASEKDRDVAEYNHERWVFLQKTDAYKNYKKGMTKRMSNARRQSYSIWKKLEEVCGGHKREEKGS